MAQLQNLRNQISEAKTAYELNEICKTAEPKQENGFDTQLTRHLCNGAWYIFTGGLDEYRKWALHIVSHYEHMHDDNM